MFVVLTFLATCDNTTRPYVAYAVASISLVLAACAHLVDGNRRQMATSVVLSTVAVAAVAAVAAIAAVAAVAAVAAMAAVAAVGRWPPLENYL